ncbi:MAG TPA: type II CAAX endopeptidase family protein [Terracidiphilus sp.]|nr:type II CAAX endopeptidase family protein [Terracidiphilus sp.]
MTQPVYTGGRLRAYLEFLAAFLYFFFAQHLAFRGAHGFAGAAWSPLLEQAMLVFLLLMGYAAMGFWLDRQVHPISEQGLPRRSGWPREAGLGLATGWAIALVCVLPLTVVGGIAISFSPQAASWGWLAADAAFFALAALGEEIAFRGYAFQRFAQAVGPVGAALGFAAIYAILQALVPGANHSSFAVSIVLTLVLSACYVRTRALWVSWGLNFAWKASRALLIGLAISGVTSHSPLVQGDPMGPFWLTGGAFGLDGSWLTFFVLLAALPVVFRLTRDLNYRYNAPVIVPGGIPVDLDAISRAQHEAAMGRAAPAAPALVQIGNAATEGPKDKGNQQTASSQPPTPEG